MLHACMDLQYDYYQGPFRLVAEEGKSKCSWVSLDDISNSVGKSEGCKDLVEPRRKAQACV